MAVYLVCNNSYIDVDNKTKKCGQMEPILDPKTDKVYCSLCNQEVPNVSHFTKITMKTLKQFSKKNTIAFGVKCQNCGKEAKPHLVNEEVSCPKCNKPHLHLSEAFKIMLKNEIKNYKQDI